MLHGGSVSINIVPGFTRGLKHNQLKRIERLGTLTIPADNIISPELARQMTEISHETRPPDRRSYQPKGTNREYVMGRHCQRLELPDFGRARVSEDRFRGVTVRCMAVKS